jgi:hypothetical protein
MSGPPGRPKELTRPSGAVSKASLGPFHPIILGTDLRIIALRSIRAEDHGGL